jgi:hypothetical protein
MADSLQVDLAFAPTPDFGPRAESFMLVSGGAGPPVSPPAPSTAQLVGLAWLHALHARACLERGQPWRAEWMICRVRDFALQLACLRHGLPAAHARGYDRLPTEVLEPFRTTLAGRLDPADLRRAFHAAMDQLLAEVEQADPELADRLRGPLDLVRGCDEVEAG